MISMIKTKELKHIAAASNGLTDELWNIISISTFHYPDHEALFTLCKGHTLTLSPFLACKMLVTLYASKLKPSCRMLNINCQPMEVFYLKDNSHRLCLNTK